MERNPIPPNVKPYRIAIPRCYEPELPIDTAREKKMNSQNSNMVRTKRSDVGKIAALARRIWPVVYGGIISEEQINFMLNGMYAPSTILDEMDRGILYFWIELEKQQSGFASFGPVLKNQSCEIHKLYISPQFHRCGLGLATLRRIEKIAVEAGASSLQLRVNRHNQPAIALYQKAGFTITREDIKDIGGGFVMDDFIFEKHLPSASG